MVEALDASVRLIYEPIGPELRRVADNLSVLADGAGLSGDDRLVAHAVVSGGKKVRPALTLLASKVYGGDPAKPITMATAVELLHIATLIHDDTVDRAETRRGRATVSNEWGGKVAVLLGDYVFATSAIYVCDTEDIYVIRRFSETIMELARGELAEHFSAFDWAQTVADYERRIYDKTATLFSTAAESGGVLSGAPPEASAALKAYGYNLGMAFQIMDDVLDFEGTEEELGKPVGNDLLQGTITLPTLLYAARHADDPLIRHLAADSRDPQDLAALVQAIRGSDVMGETLVACDRYRQAARAALVDLPQGVARQSLEELTGYLAARRS